MELNGDVTMEIWGIILEELSHLRLREMGLIRLTTRDKERSFRQIMYVKLVIFLVRVIMSVHNYKQGMDKRKVGFK